MVARTWARRPSDTTLLTAVGIVWGLVVLHVATSRWVAYRDAARGRLVAFGSSIEPGEPASAIMRRCEDAAPRGIRCFDDGRDVIVGVDGMQVPGSRWLVYAELTDAKVTRVLWANDDARSIKPAGTPPNRP